MVTKVTILPRTNGAGGFTLFTPSEERLESDSSRAARRRGTARTVPAAGAPRAAKRVPRLKGQLDVADAYAVALGGRVAEEIVYGEDEVTTGASNDLQQVRNIARRSARRAEASVRAEVGLCLHHAL